MSVNANTSGNNVSLNQTRLTNLDFDDSQTTSSNDDQLKDGHTVVADAGAKTLVRMDDFNSRLNVADQNSSVQGNSLKIASNTNTAINTSGSNTSSMIAMPLNREATEVLPSTRSTVSERKLTNDEIRIARKAFGNNIDLKNVKIVRGDGGELKAKIAFSKTPPNPAITIGNTIYVMPGRYREDFSKNGVDQNFVAHELTHVWQYQTLGESQFNARYANEVGFIVAEGSTNMNNLYEYQDRRLSFNDETLEGQAAIVGNYAQYHGKPNRNQDEKNIYQDTARRLNGTGIFGR